MSENQFQVKLNYEDAQEPTRGSDEAAGYDLYSYENFLQPFFEMHHHSHIVFLRTYLVQKYFVQTIHLQNKPEMIRAQIFYLQF